METNDTKQDKDNAQTAEGDSVETVVSENNAIEHMVFVYSSIHVEGMSTEIRVLYYKDAIAQEPQLKAHGWIHTATLNPAEFIQHLANDQCIIEEEIEALILS